MVTDQHLFLRPETRCIVFEHKSQFVPIYPLLEMDHVKRFVSDSINEAWQILRRWAVAQVITKITAVMAMLLSVMYAILSFTSCDTLHRIDNGSIKCVGNWYNNSVDANCSFSCDEGFKLIGADKIKCSESGNWTHEIPKCVKVCDELPIVPHGKLECNGNVAGSVCTVKCDESRKVEGASHMVCGEDGKWSTAAPSCVCSNPCRTGEKCDKFLSWQEFKHHINGKTSYLNFGGHPIKCSAHHKIQKFKLKWVCKCVDMTTGHEVKCKGYDSQYGSCEHSSAELIRQMVARNIYPKPCNPGSLMTGC